MQEVEVRGGAVWLPFQPMLNPDGVRRAATPALGLCVVPSCSLVCSTREGHGHPRKGERWLPCEGWGGPRGAPSQQ